MFNRLFQIGTSAARLLSISTGSSLYSSYAVTLDAVAAADFWDRTLIHEDNLMMLRIRLARPRAQNVFCPGIVVYNAPTLRVGCLYAQMSRCVTGMLTNSALVFTHPFRWKHGMHHILAQFTANVVVFHVCYARTIGSLVPATVFLVVLLDCCRRHVVLDSHYSSSLQIVRALIEFLVCSVVFVSMTTLVTASSMLRILVTNEDALTYTTTETLSI